LLVRVGAEHFDDDILVANGRAHLSAEIYDVYDLARKVDFPQINLDLIAGMVGETEAKWRDTVLHEGNVAPGTAFLSKPFTPESLLKAVRDVLEGDLPRP